LTLLYVTVTVLLPREEQGAVKSCFKSRRNIKKSQQWKAKIW